MSFGSSGSAGVFWGLQVILGLGRGLLGLGDLGGLQSLLGLLGIRGLLGLRGLQGLWTFSDSFTVKGTFQ